VVSPKSDQVFRSARLLIDDAAIYGLAFERFSSQLGIHLFWHCMGIPAPAHRARHTSAHERCWAEAGIDPATKQITTANRTDLSIVPSYVMTFDYSSLFNRRGWKASILCGVYVSNNLIGNGASKAGIGPTGSDDYPSERYKAAVEDEVDVLVEEVIAERDAAPEAKPAPAVKDRSRKTAKREPAATEDA
jgi:hypothetical protein